MIERLERHAARLLDELDASEPQGKSTYSIQDRSRIVTAVAAALLVGAAARAMQRDETH